MEFNCLLIICEFPVSLPPIHAYYNMYFDPRTKFGKYDELVSINHAFSPCIYCKYDDFMETLSSVCERDIFSQYTHKFPETANGI